MVMATVPGDGLWDSSAAAGPDNSDFSSTQCDLLRKCWSALASGHNADHFLCPLTSNVHYQLFNLVQRLKPLARFYPARHQDRDPRNHRRRAMLGDAGCQEGDSLYLPFLFHVVCVVVDIRLCL